MFLTSEGLEEWVFIRLRPVDLFLEHRFQIAFALKYLDDLLQLRKDEDLLHEARFGIFDSGSRISAIRDKYAT